MKHVGLWAIAAQGTAAFPGIMDQAMGGMRRAAAGDGCSTNAACDTVMEISDAQIGYDPNNLTPAQKISAERNNCGILTPCTFFDAEEQKVSTTGTHAWAPPGETDIRGPCPGLNAAANHGYLPRNGIATIPQTIAGLGELYGMSVDLAGFLAAYAVAIDGDILSESWSIGGPGQSLGLGLPTGEGVSWSHNKYEGDTSIGRCDAYVNNGDAHSLSTTRFGYAFSSGLDNDIYTFDKFAREFTKNTFRSEAQNPYYFAPLFSTTLVAPAAYNFVVAMMSNHTADKVDGYLNGEIFKSFFGVSGDYPDFTWNKGQERVPDNWYRRPTLEPYTAHTGVLGDLLPEFTAYPHSFRFGGNTNGPNTYTGIDLTNFTGGVYNSKNLLEGDNMACFLYQNIQQGLPDVLTTSLASDALSMFLPYLNKAFPNLSCPQVAKFNDNNLPPYPGREYSPVGPATNC